MPFTEVTLNDGRKIPAIGFGTWKVPNDVTAGEVDQAIDIGFDHIDTAQIYGNETEVGQAIKESGLSRKDIWVTTKWSGVDNKSPRQSILESLEKLGLEYLDLYLIHHPRLTKGDIRGTWKEFEGLKKEGFVKSIGVSNAVIVTTSSKKERLESYLDVGDITLSPDDVHAIDKAGIKGQLWDERKERLVKASKWAVPVYIGFWVLFKAFSA
ncbi:hypothetical protein, variant 2 [Cryptococcus amylolentus CBS 6039]|uniref:NADP-dependent oxidoreductase domain-containing protein n=1 Tax=Cryptococcus amylolentus CBS 6039 TaxID=1295533 RepID=A0A1E3HGW1_9TREE|nr:hypothetical protein, variant 2 [Cryptococcus amylolentus CBS 6039]ODN75577.1 hypothetical protein, variant 2 [Cryptococcus amylolentus CBS 6039]